MIKKCSVCGSRIVDRLMPYTETILNQEVEIQKVPASVCSSCGSIEYNLTDEMKKVLVDKIHSKKLELITQKKEKKILISNMKKIRTSKNLSQREVSVPLGFSEQRLGTIERCINIPTIPLAFDIADLLNVDITELYTREYVSTEFYDKLKLLNRDLKEIPGLKEAQDKLNKMLEEYNKLVVEIVTLKRNKSVDNKDRIKAIKEEMDKLQIQKAELMKRVKELDKDVILRQGICIDSFDWERVIRRFTE